MSEAKDRFKAKIVTGVMAAVHDPAGRVLFVAQTRGPYAGHWLLPGGGIEFGESAADTVVREFREETGVTVHSPEFLGVYELRGEWAEGAYHLVMLGFKATATEEIPAGFSGDNVGGARWAFPHEIDLHSTDMRMLTDAGLTAFPEEEIDAALTRDGIALKVYSGAGSNAPNGQSA